MKHNISTLLPVYQCFFFLQKKTPSRAETHSRPSLNVLIRLDSFLYDSSHVLAPDIIQLNYFLSVVGFFFFNF